MTVALTFEKLQLKTAKLSFSNRFQCQIIGEADPELKDQLLSFLEQYGKKEQPTSLKLSLDSFTPFRQKVLQRLHEVPFGEILTYGELASFVGHPSAGRAVGSTCRCNPFLLFIPCHRVIARGGGLRGFASGLDMKKCLLDFEAK